MTKTIKTIPKLRFPEFRDAPEWEEVRLGELSEVRDGTHDSPKFYSSGKPLVTSKNLLTNGLIDITNVGYILEEDYEQINKRSRVDIGDILFGMIGTIGNPVLVQFDGFAIKNVALIKQKDDLLNKYLVHFLNSQYIFAKFNTLHTGNTQKFIALGQIRNLTLPIPKLPEQQKIADCLCSVDELITVQSAKVEALKAHKKALMQQLFPSESKTTPRLRFPAFKNAPEWEEKKLSEVCKFVRGPFGGSLKKDIFVKDGYAVYEQSHAIYQNFDIFRYYITEEKFNELKRFSINPNDIIMSCSGTMGKFAIIPKNAKEGVINQALLKLTVKKEFDNSFVKITLELPINQEKLLSQSAGGAIKNVVSVDQIKDMVIYMPYYLEQQKIADCLCSVDELIIAQSAKVEALKAHKKALMQQLFPSTNEVNQ